MKPEPTVHGKPGESGIQPSLNLPATAPAPTGPAVELVDLHKAFGSKPVLRGLTLQLLRGETLCVIGGSGTGKSVTLKHIVGLLRPDRGTVRIDGTDIFQSDNGRLGEIRKKIGFLFQGAALLNSLNVFENVALPLREHERPSEEEIRRQVTEKLALVDLTDAAEKMPDEISGGMKKRVGLARAIIRNPEIILYDEPTAGLDPIMASTINALVLDLQKKLKVSSLVVTHDMSSVFRIADRIAMLLEGRVHKIGTKEEFRTSEDTKVQKFIYGDSEGPLRRDASR
ncbi:MAG TPA: ABC transporter ATP-binding protein [Planctomycetota bacterium]|nr:ABC transporter ATP-binding protein [Planctomycetota bacterium]